jgi:IS30 family transposase
VNGGLGFLILGGAVGAKKRLEEECLSTGKIARKIGRSTETVRRAIKRGELKAETYNGDFIIHVEDYKEWRAKYFKQVTDV